LTTSSITQKAFHRLPKFYKWGGGGVPFFWCLGWETGKDNDLICVKPYITTVIEGELTLSPICRNKPLALFAFMLKAILVRIDNNVKGLDERLRRLQNDNPSSK